MFYANGEYYIKFFLSQSEEERTIRMKRVDNVCFSTENFETFT